MNHLNYGQFDSSNADIAFTEENNYTNPASEIETRKQLSYPLKEIKDFLHDAISIDDSDNVIQLKVESGKIKYRTTGETWNDISGGIPSGGTTGQVLTKNSNTDYDVSWGSESLDTETIASGDRLVIYDNSGSKLAKSSIQFGSNANKYLRNDGTWQSVSSLGFIDTSNIIDHFENTNNSIVQKSYTATQDCYAVGGPAGSILFVTVNNVPVSNALTVIPLKAGQTIVCALDGSRPSPYRDLTIYGIN